MNLEILQMFELVQKCGIPTYYKVLILQSATQDWDILFQRTQVPLNGMPKMPGENP